VLAGLHWPLIAHGYLAGVYICLCVPWGLLCAGGPVPSVVLVAGRVSLLGGLHWPLVVGVCHSLPVCTLRMCAVCLPILLRSLPHIHAGRLPSLLCCGCLVGAGVWVLCPFHGRPMCGCQELCHPASRALARGAPVSSCLPLSFGVGPDPGFLPGGVPRGVCPSYCGVQDRLVLVFPLRGRVGYGGGCICGRVWQGCVPRPCGVGWLATHPGTGGLVVFGQDVLPAVCHVMPVVAWWPQGCVLGVGFPRTDPAYPRPSFQHSG
jgi:hypothetical protein